MNKETKRISKGYIVFMVVALIMAIANLLGLLFLNVKNQDLKKKAEFWQVKEGLCVYVEHPNAYEVTKGRIPSYLLVYDYETEKVIEVDIYDELIYTDISVGDTIVYVVDFDYTDADFLNVIHQ